MKPTITIILAALLTGCATKPQPLQPAPPMGRSIEVPVRIVFPNWHEAAKFREHFNLQGTNSQWVGVPANTIHVLKEFPKAK